MNTTRLEAGGSGPFGAEALSLLTSARRVGLVLSGGSLRCAFQVGALETLRELGIQPSVIVGVSAGVWNAAAVAAGNGHRLRHYWRAFCRMPHIDLRNLLRRQSPYNFPEIHRRTFPRYVGSERLRRPEVPPVLVGLTRLRDRRPTLLDARLAEDPLSLLLASNYLPPFFWSTPPIDGERYGDGGLTNNIPYEGAFEAGCDAVVLITMKGESEGGLYRNPREIDHVIPSHYRERMVVIRPRHRLPASFTDHRWPVINHLITLGRLRSREVLLGERHPETEARPGGRALTAMVFGWLGG